MSAAEERSSWTLPCHFHTLRLMDCRSRAEAFARSLHSKLKSLGRLTGDVQDEEDDDENGGVDSTNTFMTSSNSVNGCTTHFHNFKEISAPMAVRKSGDERTYLMSAGRPTCHGSPDAVSPPKSKIQQQQQQQHGEDELYFDFDISSPESPDDPADPVSSIDFITRQPTSSMGCSSSDLVAASPVSHLTTAKSECYHIPCGGNASAVDEESGCISAVSSVMTEQDNNDEDDDDDDDEDAADDDIRTGNAEIAASELTVYGLVDDNFLYHNDICPWDVTVSSSVSPPMSCSSTVVAAATSSCSLLPTQQPLTIVTSQPSLGSPPVHLSSPDSAFNPPFSPNGKLSTIMEQITLEEKENSSPNWQEKPGNAYLDDDDLGQGRRASDLHSNFEGVLSNESNDCVFENFSPTVLMLNDSVSNDFSNVNYINGVQNLSVDNGDIESKGCETKSCEDAAVLLVVAAAAENELSYSDASTKVEQENGGCGQEFHVDSEDVAVENEANKKSISVKDEKDEKVEEEEGQLEGDGKESSLKLFLVRVSPPSSTSSSCCDLTDECVHLDDLDCSGVNAIADSRSLLPDKTKLTVDVHLLPPGDSDSSKDGDLTPTDEDVPRRVRRSSSLKTGKTPPGTPNRKKIVRFADAMGLDLEAVKTVFLDDLPVVPSSAYFDLEDGAYLDDSEHNFTQSLTIYNSNNKNRDGNNSMILPPFTSSTSSPKLRCSLVPVFPQPGSLADFMDRIRKQRVCLESAVITGDSNIKLVVRVLNLDFHKCVTVRYTLNEWIDFHEVVADYVPESNDGFSDKFSTVLNARYLQIGERLWFAIRYVTQGREFWDNNHGQNYCFQCFPDQQYNLSPPEDSWIHFM